MATAGDLSAQTAKQHHAMPYCFSNVISAASIDAIAALEVLQTCFCLLMPDACNQSGKPRCRLR